MRKLFKNLTFVLFALVFLGVFAGCGNNTETSKVSNEESKVFRLGIPGSDDALSGELMNLAYSSGYLKEELNNAGYELEVVSFPGAGPAVNESLAGGSIDAAAYGDLPNIVSNANGINTTIIATANEQIPLGIISSNPDIKTAKDLEGKKVIVTSGTIMSYFWDQYVSANNLDSSKIELINTVDPVSLLSTKQADAYVSPLTTVNLLSGMGLGNVFDDSTKYQLNDSQAVVAVRNAYLKNNEAAAIAVNKALIRAYKSAVENPDIFYTALESANLPKSIVKTGYAWNETLSQLNPELTSRAISNLDNLKNWAKKNNLISTDINIDSIVNNSYYEKAKADIK